MTGMTTWRKEFETARQDAKDESPIVAIAPGEAVLDVEFDGGFGGAQGDPVLVWTEQRVYFPVEYAGAETLESAPRDPQPEGQRHFGGE